MPNAGIESFLHSTRVVPVPQNGSNTMLLDEIPNLSRYCLTKCGGNERTKRYQSWTGRSEASNLLAAAFFLGRSNRVRSATCFICVLRLQGNAADFNKNLAMLWPERFANRTIAP